VPGGCRCRAVLGLAWSELQQGLEKDLAQDLHPPSSPVSPTTTNQKGGRATVVVDQRGEIASVWVTGRI
jgi:hypothetical protein